MNDSTVGWIGAIVQVASLILSPLLALYTVGFQTKKNAVVSMRLKWIDEFQKAVSEYVGLMNTVNLERSQNHLTQENAFLKVEVAMRLETTMMLLITPQELAHKQLTEYTTQARVELFRKGEDYNPLVWNEIWVKIIRVSSEIVLKEKAQLRKAA